ncbi:hypothetical protein ALC57_07931 [Trachymyrmex cornetzi]|uniref:Uncharacterized protein n=1 Tax=Trachymyrmex cornetzi TaxID=471704 RepID=A0A151J7D4_9HYME|nr:hypothetical protein ALC57_07931 [Trachymyrmex cornetzi]
MNKSSDLNGGYVSSELLPGKKFESLAGQHPGAARSGVLPVSAPLLDKSYRPTVLPLLLDVQCLDSFGIITSNQEFAARMVNKSDAVTSPSAQPLPDKVTLRPVPVPVGGEAGDLACLSKPSPSIRGCKTIERKQPKVRRDE